MKTKVGIVLALVALSGCGGGGGDTPDANTPAADTSGAPQNTPQTSTLSQITLRAVLPVGVGYSVTSINVAMWNRDRMYEGSMQVSGSEAILKIDGVVPGQYSIQARGYEGSIEILNGGGDVEVGTKSSFDVEMQLSLITQPVDLHFYWPGITQLKGEYTGVKHTPSGCGAGTFVTTSSDFTIAINGSSINMEQNAFFDGVCKFDGTFTEENNLIKTASGTVKCSNFDEGTWSSSMIRSTGDNSMIAAVDVSIPARACDYKVTYIGFLK